MKTSNIKKWLYVIFVIFCLISLTLLYKIYISSDYTLPKEYNDFDIIEEKEVILEHYLKDEKVNYEKNKIVFEIDNLAFITNECLKEKATLNADGVFADIESCN